MVKRVFAVAGLLVLLAACGPGPKAIVEGTLRDSVFSVEPRVNGTTNVWFTHDDVGVYCTADAELGEKALEILKSLNPNVIATYRSINTGDPEVSYLLDPSSGCGDTDKGTTRYKLLTIEQASSE